MFITVTLLTKLFIKNKDNIKDAGVRRAYGMLCSVVGICLNVILFCGKFFAGTVSGSVSITADSFNNLSDAGSSLITLIGFRFAGKKPDPDHPFGHGRIEYLSGFAVSALIMLMGFELGKSSVEKIIRPEPLDDSYFILTVMILAVSIAVKVYMSFYNRRIGKKIDSGAMKATAADSLSDTIATSVVLVSTVIAHFTNLLIDGYVGILVALFILYAGIGAAKDTLGPLLGQTPDEETVRGIERIVMSHKEICGIHDMVIHDYGPGRFMVSLHAEVPGDGDIYVLHDIIDCIEHELGAEFDCEAVIHMDPIDVGNPELAVARQRISDFVKELGEDVTIHDLRMVPGDTHTNFIFDIVIPYTVKMSDREIDEWMKKKFDENFDNCFAVFKIDRKYV